MTTDIPMTAIASAMAQEKPATGSPLSRLLFPYYLAGSGSTALVRFLPDADEDNALPWLEQHTMRFPFGGIINSDHDTHADTVVSVPALSSWGRKDRVTDDLKPRWNGDDNDKLVAKIYYRKVSYLMPALIVSTSVVERQEPESPIRLLRLGKQLHDVVKQGLMGSELEWSPFGYDHGRDFKITKTQQGAWANYSTSSFSYKERSLNATERAAIDKYGLLDLSDFRGVEPDQDVIDVVWEMYQASLQGKPFDNARWGSHFRAFVAGPGTTTTTQAADATAAG